MNGAPRDSTLDAINADELLARCMGNVSFAVRVLDKFQDRFGHDLEQLEKDLNNCDSNAIALVAHRIKGATANISAPQLNEWAAKIERLGRDNQLADIHSGIRELRNEWSRFTDSVSTLEWNQCNGR